MTSPFALTVQDPVSVSGGSLITAITGTYNGQAITGLLPLGAYAGNDNLLFIFQNPLLSGGGFSFNGAFGNRNIFWNGSFYRDFNRPDITFSIRQIGEGAVPEPATWAMMLIGFGAMGVSLRRRRRASVAAIA